MNINGMTVLDAACAFRNLGLSVIRVDATKRPSGMGSWKQHQERRATEAELAQWFGSGSAEEVGLGIVCGAVSGNLIAFDFDVASFIGRWKTALKAQAPALYDKVMRQAVVVSTRKGYHVEVRCQDKVPGNQVLAHALLVIPDGAEVIKRGQEQHVLIDGKERLVVEDGGQRRALVTAIETRGEGGYVVAPPSSPYKIQRGRYDEILVVTGEELEMLLAAARSITEHLPSSVRVITGVSALNRDHGERPGDAFNAVADPLPLLEASGWTVLPPSDPSDPVKAYLARPGKEDGVSATWNGRGSRLLYVFSSNAQPFEAEKAYTPFAVRASLEYGGDYSACARALRQEGYGGDNSRAVAGQDDGERAVSVTLKTSQQSQDGTWEAPVPLAPGCLPPFPVEVFPTNLGTFVAAAAHSLQVPPDLIAFLVFGVASTLANKVAEVSVKGTYTEPVNLYLAPVLPPASRKSAAFALCMRPLLQLEARIQQEEAQVVREYETRSRILAARREEALKQLEKADDQEAGAELSRLDREIADLKPATQTRLWADDITPEALACALADNDGRMAILSAEGGVFDMMAGRYSKTPPLDVYLKGHAQDTLRVQRKGSGGGGTILTIQKPSLVMCVTVQPTVLSALSSKGILTGKGLMARFLYSYPPDLAGRRLVDTEEIPTALLSSYNRFVGEMAQLRPAQDDDGVAVPHGIRLTSEALAQRNAFELELDRRYGRGATWKASGNGPENSPGR
jgi:hypothetical protein